MQPLTVAVGSCTTSPPAEGYISLFDEFLVRGHATTTPANRQSTELIVVGATNR